MPHPISKRSLDFTGILTGEANKMLPIPTTAEEARAMVRLGMFWLDSNGVPLNDAARSVAKAQSPTEGTTP